MSKTKRHYTNKKRHYKRHTKRHYKRHNKKHTKRHLYRKRREFEFVPGSKSVPIFSPPDKKRNTPILDSSNNDQNNHVGIIHGLRNYLKLRA
jgi:hypothetical protein